jgi:hypothetical protein
MLVFCLHKGAGIKLINQINTIKPVYNFIILDLNIYLFIRISVGNRSTSRQHGHFSQIAGYTTEDSGINSAQGYVLPSPTGQKWPQYKRLSPTPLAIKKIPSPRSP